MPFQRIRCKLCHQRTAYGILKARLEGFINSEI
uniref:Uncharacterized protein n=1 Tax=Anguilla anguilla TaxID=7936 RepID=A0A0E9U849_ANGAN